MMDLNTLWVLICAIMVLEMQAGFLCLEAGLSRSKNSIHVALKNTSDLCFVTLVFWAVGFGVMFGPSMDGLIGVGGFLFDGSFDSAGSSVSYAMFYFQLAFAGAAVTIVSGAIAERALYKGYLVMTVIVAALIYPVFGHWAWGGAFIEGDAGWLAAAGFIDFAGSTTIHSIGGWIALAYVLMLGRRLGRFSKTGRSFEPSNLSFAALGALLLWIGWAGFNAGSTLMFDGRVPEILVNTALAAAAGGAFVVAFAVARNQKIHVTTQLNGVLAGLVAVTASCHLVDPPDAVAIGAIGAVVMTAAKILLERFRIDDAVDAAPVHLAAGIWGTLAVALFGDPDAFVDGDRWAQFEVQAMGVLAAGLWAFPLSLATLWLIKRMIGLRVHPRDERVGLNVAEHDESNALYVLTQDMLRHRKDGRFRHRAWVEPATEAGVVARHYNRVLDRAEVELREREHAVALEAEARKNAEDAQVAVEDAQREAEWAARHDALTGLANRRLFEETLSRLDASADHGAGFAVICADLDHFKEVNDTHGHAAGDAMLRHAAQALRETLRATDRDVVARVGGDEFVAILAPRAGGEAEIAEMAEDLLSAIRTPLRHERAVLRASASIGYAHRGPDARTVVLHADQALYKAKQDGRNQARPFTQDLAERARRRVEISENLKPALAAGQFEPFFQPKFDARTGAFTGVESLARWRHPTLGVLAPGAFLDIAEELSVTEQIDEQILDGALKALEDWTEAGWRPQISVNVSARRLRTSSLLSELAARDNIPAGRLSFEILETVFVDDAGAAFDQTIEAIKGLGIEIEIDDFGTGHASVSSILALDPDRVKLDRLFVKDVESDRQRRRLMRSMVGVAESMGLEVVAEGVETPEQAAILAEDGVSTLQGFGLARPMDRAAFDEWLAAGARPAMTFGPHGARVA